MKNIKLRPEQQLAYDGLRWLLDPKGKREGRTLTIAMALLETGRNNLGTELPLFDHFGSALGNKRSMVTTVRSVSEQQYGDKYKVLSDPAYNRIRVIERGGKKR